MPSFFSPFFIFYNYYIFSPSGLKGYILQAAFFSSFYFIVPAALPWYFLVGVAVEVISLSEKLDTIYK